MVIKNTPNTAAVNFVKYPIQGSVNQNTSNTGVCRNRVENTLDRERQKHTYSGRLAYYII